MDDSNVEPVIRILHLEDDPLDSEMARRSLRQGGLETRIDRVYTLDALRKQIDCESYALILSDYTLPGMDALEALRLARQACPETPYIFLSGTLGEDVAIETLKMGATDYVLKQRMERLVPAVRRALQEAEDQSRRRQAEKALRQSEESFRLTFENAAVGMAHVGLDGRWLSVNERLCRIVGYSCEELLSGLTFQDITHPEDLDADLDQLAQLLSGRIQTYSMEKRYIHKEGRLVWVNLTVSLQRDESGQPLYCIAVVEDITARKRAEEALQAAYEKLHEADRRKDEFLAMLAHELRNPLAPVRNAVQIMTLAGPKEPMMQRQREIIDRQVTHMARLLDDLLDVSRITRGKINLKKEPVRLVDVLARAVETAAPLVEAHEHTLSVELHSQDESLIGDFDRLIQIVGNLLTNAAKYTENGGRIWLESAREDKTIVIRVRDTGMGIAPELLPNVFDVFTQAERSLDRSQGGLGLGLALVRSLTRMHGGSVEAHSEGAGQGSEFIVRLPAPPLAEAPGTRTDMPAIQHDASARRILVVDDVIDTANSLAELLDLLGHEVKTAYDGASALKQARQFKPDVILLDIGLPGMNGFEVARQVRRDPALEGTVLVALTGYGQEEDRRNSEEAGFNQHFTKPVELRAVKALLDQMGS